MTKINLSEIIPKVQTTAKQRLKIKHMTVILSLECRIKLALAKEETGQVNATAYIRISNRIEQERKLFQIIRIMENKMKGDSTYKVIITSADGNVQELTNKKAYGIGDCHL